MLIIIVLFITVNLKKLICLKALFLKIVVIYENIVLIFSPIKAAFLLSCSAIYKMVDSEHNL